MSTPQSLESASSKASADSVAPSFNVDAIRSIAVDAYRASCELSSSSDIVCNVIEPPSSGSSNVVYELRFSDGACWAMRIPFEHSDMRRNLVGHQFVLSHTSLPVPKIHAYSLDSDNALGHPYTLMDFARGRRLVDVWYDQSWWTGGRTKSRMLASLARHMVQLASIEFQQIGSVERDDATGEHYVAPFPDDPDYALGPFDTQTAYLRALLTSLSSGSPDPNRWSDHLLLQLLISTLPDPRYESAPFTLAHPDFDSQNVFVDEETGELSAFIDWDDLAVLPRQLGALTYPSWLTVDYDPVMYEMYKDAKRYDHADDLHKYRAIYLEAVRACGGDACADVTRNSHITSAISIALGSSHTTEAIICQLGKLLCGSARLVWNFSEGIRSSGWLKRDPQDMVSMPEFLLDKEIFGDEESEDGVASDEVESEDGGENVGEKIQGDGETVPSASGST